MPIRTGRIRAAHEPADLRHDPGGGLPIRALPLALAVLGAPALAQQPVFQTPGTPSYAAVPAAPLESGQSDRFASAFNPAFSFVVDGVLDWLGVDAAGAEEGVGLELRALEFGAQSWVDPDAWAYFVAVTDGETLAIEEAAIHYVGLSERDTLRAGRFFVDFGKQMQLHVHELRTLERPLVLATYLGDEVKGDGLQWDAWTPVGDATGLRWSLGVFADLVPESEEDEGAPAFEVAGRKDPEDLNFTARVTAFSDLSDSSTIQLGASGRFIPDATAELNGSTVEGLESTVLGIDLTYGWISADALTTWTAGGELLFNLGDTVARIDDGGTPSDPSDDLLTGFDDPGQTGWYAFVDRGWARKHALGAQLSLLELPVEGGADATELELYYTRTFSEYHRLRLVAATRETDLPDGDSLRFALQYTAALGAHGHGMNW
jgi:hypothetical protein